MRTRSKLILAALTAMILLGLAVSAIARNIAVLNFEKGFRVVWTALELSNNVGLETVRCPVTIEGTFHRHTFAKVGRTLVGYVTRAIVRGERPPCTGGTARIFNESLPWHVQYSSFTGTLPAITAIVLRLVGARFAVTPNGGPNCNATTTDTNPALGTFETSREAGGLLQISGVTASGEIPLEGAGLCALGTGSFREPPADGSVTVLGETATIKVQLIT